jgi:transcription antitermination protein NusB
MASYRHLARTCVMQAIFITEFRESSPEEVLTSLLKEFAPNIKEEKFALDTLNGIIKNKKKILKLIGKYAPEWPIDKIAGVDRAILEIGVYEIVFNEEIPPIVAINEAVEIAKHFGDENSSKFINGVLSTIMKEQNAKI